MPGAGASPTWFNIPGHQSFLRTLASGIIERWGDTPEDLADLLILVPNRRSARQLSEALLEASRKTALLVPRIRAIGDLEDGEPPFEPGHIALDLPAAVRPMARRFGIERIIARHFEDIGETVHLQHRLDLADVMTSLLDSLQIEEIRPPASLAGLVEAELAEHWAISSSLIDRVLREWPEVLREQGLIDPMERRTRLLNALADQWSSVPPRHPVLAAGSTGSVPATARLLGVIAGCPRGAVVLPGLDQNLDEASWSALDDQHPQFGLRRLIQRFRLARADVAQWRPDIDPRGISRQVLVNDALRPADRTADWLSRIESLRNGKLAGAPDDPILAALDGLHLIKAPDALEAARVVALLMREALETPDKTIALITPDQKLARGVRMELRRWDIEIDSSASDELAATPAGILARLVCDLLLEPLNPMLWLALLKHPLPDWRDDGSGEIRARLERAAFRKTMPARLDDLLDRVRDDPQAQAQIGFVARGLAPLAGLWSDDLVGVTIEAATRGLIEALETLCPPGQPTETSPLWSSVDGEALGQVLAELLSLPPTDLCIDRRDFHAVISRSLASGQVLHPRGGHPRLKILGTIEGRLFGADRLILAGLEEQVWPQTPTTDPLLSRPLRAKLGMPSPERRIGLSAHDFAQACCHREVFLVHTARRDNSPSIPSRWLWRLETLVKGAGLKIPGRDDLLTLAAGLDAHHGAPETCKRPAPCPPVADRPTEMAVTRVEALIKDPYSVWARDIARLRPLDPPGGQFDARARGTAIHTAMEHFSQAWPYADAATAADTFERLYLDQVRAAGGADAALVREQTLARRMAAAITEFETDRRSDGAAIHTEIRGEIEIQSALGPFKLSAKADRIEVTRAGAAHIIDFKTGSPPTRGEVKKGKSPQLTLTAAIVQGGGFDLIGKQTAGTLVYVQMSGREPPVNVQVAASEAESALLTAETLDGLKELLTAYADPDQPYLPATQSDRQRIQDYAHLSRIGEWGRASDGEDGGDDA